jgi:hypothetical protein
MCIDGSGSMSGEEFGPYLLLARLGGVVDHVCPLEVRVNGEGFSRLGRALTRRRGILVLVHSEYLGAIYTPTPYISQGERASLRKTTKWPVPVRWRKLRPGPGGSTVSYCREMDTEVPPETQIGSPAFSNRALTPEAEVLREVKTVEPRMEIWLGVPKWTG